MFWSIQSIPGLIFATSDVKSKIWPGVEDRHCTCTCYVHTRVALILFIAHFTVFTAIYGCDIDRAECLLHL